MPQVPYTGSATVPLSENPIPNESINTPLSAFGGDIAAATSHLGSAVSGAGDELFKRGLAMQELANHSEANLAAADFMEKAGQLHANFKMLQGKDAVDAFPKYTQDLKDLRVQMQGKLSNDMSRKLFESESLGTVGRTIFNGAEYAGQQNRAYAIASNQARVKSAQNYAGQNPGSEEIFQEALQTTEVNTRQQYSMAGASKEATELGVQEAKSAVWASRIQALAREEPFKADQLLQKAIKEGAITGDSLARVESVVQTARRGVGAKQISQSTFNGEDLSWGKGIVSPAQARIGITGSENDGKANYEALGPEVPGRGRALGRYQVMPENLEPWLKEAGLASMTPEEFLKSPTTQDALFDFKFGQMMKQYGSFNEAASVWFSGKTIADAGGVTDATPTTKGHDVPWYLAKSNKALAQNAGLSELISHGKDSAKALFPNDQLLPDYVEQRIIQQHGYNKRVEQADDWDNKQVIYDKIIEGDNGKPFTSFDQVLRSSDEVNSAYSQMPPSKQIQIQKNFKSYTAAETKQTQAEASNKLLGLAHGDPSDVDKFLNTNIYAEPLSRKDMDYFQRLQTQLFKDRGGSVEIKSALKMVEPMLTASGVDLKDKETMAKFRGAYIDGIQDWKRNNPNKPLDQQTAKSIATDAISKQSSENFYYGRDYLFNLPLPKTIEKQLRDKNPDISDAELETYRSEYVRQQLQAMQKTRAAKSQ